MGVLALNNRIGICWQCRVFELLRSCRTVSTTSAINRGLRATRDTHGRPRKNGVQGLTDSQLRDDTVHSIKATSSRRPRVTTRSRLATRSTAPRTDRSDVDARSDVPVRVRFTTAGSQFLYGKNTIRAAVQGKRRKLYRMYISDRVERSTSPDRSAKLPTHEYIALAHQAGVPYTIESNPALLMRMSDGRPHNGIILEASRLPAPPVLGLGRYDPRRSLVPLTLQRQSTEEMIVNGDPQTMRVATDTWRQPFVVLLDGITDPGNVGNIIRSCHFYGVDAVAVATNTCADLSSSVMAKASAGACEGTQIFALPQPSNFVYNSAKAGWKVYAAVAPGPTPLSPSSHEVSRPVSTASIADASPLAQDPCILMLGAEDEGLRESLRNRAGFSVTIEGGPRSVATPNVGVDSMNVGAATGVLLEAFLRRPSNAAKREGTTGDLGW